MLDDGRRPIVGGKITRSNKNLLLLSNKIVLPLFVETDMKRISRETTTDLNKILQNASMKDLELHTIEFSTTCF